MDAISEWDDARERVRGLTADLDDNTASTIVPACPDWTITDLLSHMIGLDADVLAGNEPDDHNPEWTQAQVGSRAGRTITELLAEWDALAEPLRQWMRDNTTRPLGDAIIHEQDLRAALSRPGARDTPGLRMIRDRMLERVGSKLEGRPPLALVGETMSWCSSGDPDAAAVVVRASDYDLFRAVLCRRSAAQVRSWVERGDIEPYLDSIGALGPLPDHDVDE